MDCSGPQTMQSQLCERRRVYITAADVSDPNGKEIWERVFRGINEKAGDGTADQAARSRARKRVDNELLSGSELTSKILANGLQGLSKPAQKPELAITIKQERLDRVLDKIFRCCFYKIHGFPQPSTADSDFGIVRHDSFAKAYEILGQHLRWVDLGGGVLVGAGHVSNSKISVTAINILLWKSVYLRCFIESPL